MCSRGLFLSTLREDEPIRAILEEERFQRLLDIEETLLRYLWWLGEGLVVPEMPEVVVWDVNWLFADTLPRFFERPDQQEDKRLSQMVCRKATQGFLCHC